MNGPIISLKRPYWAPYASLSPALVAPRVRSPPIRGAPPRRHVCARVARAWPAGLLARCHVSRRAGPAPIFLPFYAIFNP